jgi:hypothetical protein
MPALSREYDDDEDRHSLLSDLHTPMEDEEVIKNMRAILYHCPKLLGGGEKTREQRRLQTGQYQCSVVI